jgi:hypothetical protein
MNSAKLVYKFNTIPIKILMTLLKELDEKQSHTEHWWLTPVSLATWETKIERMAV